MVRIPQLLSNCEIFVNQVTLSLFSNFSEREGFGVLVADLLSAPATPACALPAHPCADCFSHKAFALKSNSNAPVRIPQLLSNCEIFVNQVTLSLFSNFSEREGFEPSEPVRAQRFSRPPDSTALASLLGLIKHFNFCFFSCQ